MIALIKEVEEPIKSGITVFDDKRRNEKVLSALEYLNVALEKNEINDKYKRKISIHDIKITLTNSMKSIKEETQQALKDFQSEYLSDDVEQ